jgi:DNA repair protein RecO (recombination protein O)
MSTEKTDALVIRLADFSNTSRVVTLFTRDFGKTAAVAKGAKRLKGPFDSALDLLTECRIAFIHKTSGALDILTEAHLIRRFQPKAGDLHSLYGGYYVAELLDGLSEPYDRHPVLYDEASGCLARLGTEADRRLTILRFELAILNDMGQLPESEACVVCGRVLAGEAVVGFKLTQGGLVCGRCLQDGEATRQISGGTAAILRKLSEEGDGWQRVALSPQQHAELRGVITAIISHALGRRPKMLRYLTE